MTARTFQQDLAYSLEGREEEFWGAVYRRSFPDLMHTELCDEKEKQKQGVDRVLYLANSNVLYVDEKKRREAYPDIGLEYIGNTTYQTPGWMEKDLIMDYLAYAVMPLRIAYLLPWPLLRRAWNQNRDQWIARYHTFR